MAKKATPLSTKENPLSAIKNKIKSLDEKHLSTALKWRKLDNDAFTSTNLVTRVKSYAIVSAERYVYNLLGDRIGDALRQSKRASSVKDAREIRKDYWLRYKADTIEKTLGVFGYAWAQRIRQQIGLIKDDDPMKGFANARQVFIGIIEHVKDLEEAVIKQTKQTEKILKEFTKDVSKAVDSKLSENILKSVTDKIDTKFKKVEDALAKQPEQIRILQTDISQVKSIVDNNQNAVRALNREITEINSARANDAAQIAQLALRINALEQPRDSRGRYKKKISDPTPETGAFPSTSRSTKVLNRPQPRTLSSRFGNQLNSGFNPLDLLGGSLTAGIGARIGLSGLGALGGAGASAAPWAIPLGLAGYIAYRGTQPLDEKDRTLGKTFLDHMEKAGPRDKNLPKSSDKPTSEKSVSDLMKQLDKNPHKSNEAKKLLNKPARKSFSSPNMSLERTIDDRIYRDRIDREKSQFMQFGALPPGFEFIVGNRGRLGSAAAVAASGAQPLSGDYSSDYGNSPYYNGPNSGGVNGNPIRSSGGRQGGYGYSGSPAGSGDTRYDSQSGGKQMQIWQKESLELGKQSDPGTWKKNVNLPVTNDPASVRYNNPGASYPSASDEKFGIKGYGIIGGGHKIGLFPSVVHGAASNFALWERGYTGLSLKEAVNKWRGGNGSLNVPDGFDPNMKLTKEHLQNKEFMTSFFKGMAKHEAGRKTPISEEQWSKAYDLYKAGGIDEYNKQNPLVDKETGLPILSLPTKEALANKERPTLDMPGTMTSGSVIQSQGKEAAIRKLPVSDRLNDVLKYAANKAGVEFVVTSGGQAKIGTGGPRTGSTRHDLGNAADGDLYVKDEKGNRRKLDFTNPNDVERYQAFVQHAAAAGATGIGAGSEYMGSSRIHVGFGNEATWGSAFKNGTLQDAFNTGRKNQINLEEWKKSQQPNAVSNVTAMPDKVEKAPDIKQRAFTNFRGDGFKKQESDDKQRNTPWTSLEKPPTKEEVDQALKNGTKFFDFDSKQTGGKEIAAYIQEKGGNVVGYNRGTGNQEWNESNRDVSTVISEVKQQPGKYVHWDNFDQIKDNDTKRQIIQTLEQNGKTVIPKNDSLFWQQYLKDNPNYAEKIPYGIIENYNKADNTGKDAVTSLDKTIPGGMNAMEWQKGNSGISPAQAQSNPIPTIHMKGTEVPSGGQGGYDSRGANVYNTQTPKPVEPVKQAEPVSAQNNTKEPELPKLELLKPDGSNARPIDGAIGPIDAKPEVVAPEPIKENPKPIDGAMGPVDAQQKEGTADKPEKPQSSSESGNQSTAGSYGGGSRHNPETRGAQTGSGGRGAQGRCFI